MAKVTSKLQVTLPKRLAEAHGIVPGDRIEFESSGDDIRIVTEAWKRSCELSVKSGCGFSMKRPEESRSYQRSIQRPADYGNHFDRTVGLS